MRPKAKARAVAVPRRFPNAAVRPDTTAYGSRSDEIVREREGERGRRKKASWEGGSQSPATKGKMSQCKKSNWKSAQGSESSVSAGVNHLQTGRLHPSVLRDEIHYS